MSLNDGYYDDDVEVQVCEFCNKRMEDCECGEGDKE